MLAHPLFRFQRHPLPSGQTHHLGSKPRVGSSTGRGPLKGSHAEVHGTKLPERGAGLPSRPCRTAKSFGTSLGQLSPLYVLYGEEPFFISEIVKTLLGTVVDESQGLQRDGAVRARHGRGRGARGAALPHDVRPAARHGQGSPGHANVEAQGRWPSWRPTSDPVPTTVLVAHPHKKADSR